MANQNLETFLNAYITCMLWSSTDENGEPLDGLDLPLSIEAKRIARDDCESFLFAAKHLIADLPDFYGSCVTDGGAYAYMGHDFWLTRNGHGAGFWDRGLGDLGERLTALCKTYGEKDPYVGDDNKIYL